MTRLFLLGLVLCMVQTSVSAQYNRRRSESLTRTTAKGNYFVSIGVNRAWFGLSDLRLKGQGYDLTLQKVSATDRPANFTFQNYFSVQGSQSIPQYSLSGGYYFKNNWYLAMAYDHLKYVYQHGTYALNGSVRPELDPDSPFAGDWSGEELTTDASFFGYENANGLNYLRAEMGYSREIFGVGRKKQLSLVGSGALSTGALYSINNFFFLGERDIATRSLSGLAMSAHLSLRLEIFRHFFLKAEGVGGYLQQFRVRNRPDDLNAFSSQRVLYSSSILSFGLNFRLKEKEDCNCPKW